MDIRAARQEKGTMPPKGAPTQSAKPSVTPTEEKPAEASLRPDRYDSVVLAEYMAFLAENGIDEPDVLELLDALLTSGNVKYDTKLFDRIEVTFQMRPAWVNDKIAAEADRMNKEDGSLSVMRFNNLAAMYNLAGSLTQYGQQKYELPTEETFEVALNRVRNMPYVIQNALVNKLAIFDRAIAAATSDWAVRNFTKPRKEGSAPAA